MLRTSKARTAMLAATAIIVLAGAAWLGRHYTNRGAEAPVTDASTVAASVASIVVPTLAPTDSPTSAPTVSPTVASTATPIVSRSATPTEVLAASPTPNRTEAAASTGTGDKTAQTAEFLSRQARALRPGFEGQLAGLTSAPRYTIDASYDAASSTVKGLQTVEYVNTTGQPQSELVFRLLPNAETIYGGGGMTIEKVTVDGAAAEHVLEPDATVLRVPLGRSLAPGSAASVEMRFDATVPTDVGRGDGYGIFNRSRGVTSLAGWHPILAANRGGWRAPPVPTVGDVAVFPTSLYEVKLAVPNGSTVVSTGEAIDVQTHGDQDVWHMVSGPARDFTAAIGDFRHIESDVGGVMVRSHYLAPSDGSTSAEESASMAQDAFEVYADRFGPYPLRELDVVEANVPIGGYEFSGLVFLDHDLRVKRSRERYRYIVGHEVAHQWWYYLAGNDAVLEPWLDESMVTYAAALYVEATDGAAAAEAMLDDWAREYGPRDASDPPLDSPATMFHDWVTYRTTTYYRGAQFLRELRREMGDEAFFSMLKRHQAESLHGFTSTDGFLELAEEASEDDLGPLRAKWFD